MKIKRTLLLFSLAALLFGCGGNYTAPVKPPRGLIFTSYKAPLDVNYKDTETKAREGAENTKYIRCIFMPLSVGFDNVSIKEAAEKAGIKKIYYADYEYFSVLGLYQELRVIPYGE